MFMWKLHNNILFSLDYKLLIKYFYSGKMGNFIIKNNHIKLELTAENKFIKLPHFFLIDPFEFANILHENNKCSQVAALNLIRDCLEEFAELSIDQIGKRKSFYTTRSSNFHLNLSLKSPVIEIRHRTNFNCPTVLKQIYDAPWAPLSPPD